MVDPVLGEELRKRRCMDISKEDSWKNDNSGLLEFNNMDRNNNNWDSKLTEEIAMSLVSKKEDVQSVLRQKCPCVALIICRFRLLIRSVSNG